MGRFFKVYIDFFIRRTTCCPARDQMTNEHSTVIFYSKWCGFFCICTINFRKWIKYGEVTVPVSLSLWKSNPGQGRRVWETHPAVQETHHNLSSSVLPLPKIFLCIPDSQDFSQWNSRKFSYFSQWLIRLFWYLLKLKLIMHSSQWAKENWAITCTSQKKFLHLYANVSGITNNQKSLGVVTTYGTVKLAKRRK